jgi:hypothetical protein
MIGGVSGNVAFIGGGPMPPGAMEHAARTALNKIDKALGREDT